MPNPGRSPRVTREPTDLSRTTGDARPRDIVPSGRSEPIGPVHDDAVEAFTPGAEKTQDATRQKPEAPRPVKKRRPLRGVLLLAGPILVAAAALYFYLNGGRFASTDDAYVKADVVTVATDVSGTVASVEVHNDQHVSKGDVLFRLDDEPYRLAFNAAQADLANAANEITAFKQLYQNQIATVQTANTDVAYYQITTQRALDLVGRGAGPQATFDQAHHDLQSSRAKVAAAQLQADAVLASLGGNADQPVETYPLYLKAKAQLDKATRELRHTTVLAAKSGTVTNVDSLQPGNYLTASQPAFSLVVSDHVWIEANFKETDLTYVRSGNPAEISVNSYPGAGCKAIVDTISPATGNQFSILPAQNSSGNWVKVVQRIPVRLKVSECEDAPQLRAGMSTVVDIDTGHQRTMAGLIDSIRHTIGL